MFVDVLRKKIRDRIEELSDVVIGGQLDLADYKHYTGQIMGLALADREITDLIEAQRIADD